MAELGFRSLPSQQGTAPRLVVLIRLFTPGLLYHFFPLFYHQPLVVEDRPTGGWLLSALFVLIFPEPGNEGES